MQKKIFIVVISVMVLCFGTIFSFASEKGEYKSHHTIGSHFGGGHSSAGYGHKSKRGHKKMHIFGTHWTETLSEDQKNQIDKMHLEATLHEKRFSPPVC